MLEHAAQPSSARQQCFCSDAKRRGPQVAWLSGLMDFVFPYLVQFLREYTGKVGPLSFMTSCSVQLSGGIDLLSNVAPAMRVCSCSSLKHKLSHRCCLILNVS